MTDIIERLEHAAHAWENSLTVCGDYMPSPAMLREAKAEIEALRQDKSVAVAAERERCAQLCEADAFVEQWKGLAEAVRRIRQAPAE